MDPQQSEQSDESQQSQQSDESLFDDISCLQGK